MLFSQIKWVDLKYENIIYILLLLKKNILCILHKIIKLINTIKL